MPNAKSTINVSLETRKDIQREFPKQCIMEWNFIANDCFSFKVFTYQAAAKIVKYLISEGLPAYRNDNYVFVSNIKI